MEFTALEDETNGAKNEERRIENETFPGPFDLLPDEIILKILSFVSLPDLALKMWTKLGNMRFRILCQDPELTKFIFMEKSWDEKTACKILKMSRPRMKALLLNDTEYAGTLVRLALENCPQLESLLCDQNVFTSDLMDAMGKSNSLHEICLNKTALTKTFLSTATFIANVHNLTNLTRLIFNSASIDFDDYSADLLSLVAHNCKNLECVQLPYSESITDEVFKSFLDKVQRTLKVLKVHGQMLTDGAICQLKSCRLLDTLCLDRAVQLGREGLLAITRHISLTGHLGFSNATAVTGGDFVEAFVDNKFMANLTTLYLPGCSGLDDLSLDVIAMSCSNLTRISVACCNKIGDEGVRSVLRRCQKLRRFCLIDTNVTEKAFIDNSCNNLKKIFVSSYLVMKVAELMPQCQVTDVPINNFSYSRFRRYLLRRVS